MYTDLAGNSVGNQVAGRPRQLEIIRINLKGTSCQKGRGTELAQDFV
jgi:hypothetical protein